MDRRTLRLNTKMTAGFFKRLADESSRAGLQFLLVGGNAVNAWGYTRTTLDADLLIAEDSLPAWRSFWEERGYCCVHQTASFCQLRSSGTQERYPVDLMLVDAATFRKLYAAGQLRPVGNAEVRTPDPLHIIAMKLHALRNPARSQLGRDLQDILGLIRSCRIDTRSVAFAQVLNRYADENTKAEIRRQLGTS